MDAIPYLKFREAFSRILENLEKHREYLNDLDSPIGDSDHGESVCKAFAKVKEAIDALPEAERDIGALFATAGKTILFSGGAAMGPLYGTAFLDAGKVAGGKSSLTFPEFVAVFAAFVEGVRRRGGASPGDKTMYDTLFPTLEALREAQEKGMPLREALEYAISAARKGMESTKDMLAKRGRSSRLGERSLGHIDPGAASSYFIIEAWFSTLKEEEDCGTGT